MLGINLKHSLATVAVAVGVLIAAGSASAATHQSGLVAYTGHAGLGASAYQHKPDRPRVPRLADTGGQVR